MEGRKEDKRVPIVFSLSSVTRVTLAVPEIRLKLIKFRQSCADSPSLISSVRSERLNSAGK